MSFTLVYGDFDARLPLPFETHIEERLYKIISQAEPPESAEGAHVDLARRIVDVITAMLEVEVLPPSDKQLKYAIAISKELELELPSNALKYRDAMNVFLSTHADTYRKSKSLRRQQGMPR